jgi:hypothetical protein
VYGIPNNLLNPFSNKFKIVLTIQKQEVFLLGILNKSRLDMQKSSQLGTSRAPVADGMTNHTLKKLGHNLRPTSPPHTVSTNTCRGNLPQHPVIIKQTPL